MKDTKKYLREKGIKLFKEHGYDNVSVDYICKDCGVTKGSFYHHYSSKDDLLISYYIEVIINHENLISVILEHGTYKEKMWKILEKNLDPVFAIGPELIKRILITDSNNGTRILTATMDKANDEMTNYIEVMIQLVKAGQKKGEISSEFTPEDLWSTYISGLFGIVFNMRSEDVVEATKKKMKKEFDIVFSK